MKEILFPLLYMYVFWLGFLMYASVINLGWTKLSLFLKILLVPPGVVFLTMDFCFNVTVGTLIFLQLPTSSTLTLSMRMAANIATDTGWRKTLSALVVNNLLLPFTKNY